MTTATTATAPSATDAPAIADAPDASAPASPGARSFGIWLAGIAGRGAHDPSDERLLVAADHRPARLPRLPAVGRRVLLPLPGERARRRQVLHQPRQVRVERRRGGERRATRRSTRSTSRSGRSSGSTASPRTGSCPGCSASRRSSSSAYVGRRVAGPLVGLIAAAIVAVYPFMWINDGMLMSESLAVLMAALVLAAAYAFVQAPRPRQAVLLGLACGFERAHPHRDVAPAPRSCSSRSRCSPAAGPGSSASGSPRSAAASRCWRSRRGSRTTSRGFDKPVFLSTGIGQTLAVGLVRRDLLRQPHRLLLDVLTRARRTPTRLDESQRDSSRATTRSTTSKTTSRGFRSSSPRGSAGCGASSSPGRPPRSTGGSKGRGRVAVVDLAVLLLRDAPVRGRRPRHDVAPEDHDPPVVAPIVIATFAAATTFGITALPRAGRGRARASSAAIGIATAWTCAARTSVAVRGRTVTERSHARAHDRGAVEPAAPRHAQHAHATRRAARSSAASCSSRSSRAAIRVMNVLWWRPTTDRAGYHGFMLGGDAFYYHWQANALAARRVVRRPVPLGQPTRRASRAPRTRRSTRCTSRCGHALGVDSVTGPPARVVAARRGRRRRDRSARLPPRRHRDRARRGGYRRVLPAALDQRRHADVGVDRRLVIALVLYAAYRFCRRAERAHRGGARPRVRRGHARPHRALAAVPVRRAPARRVRYEEALEGTRPSSLSIALRRGRGARGAVGHVQPHAVRGAHLRSAPVPGARSLRPTATPSTTARRSATATSASKARGRRAPPTSRSATRRRATPPSTTCSRPPRPAAARGSGSRRAHVGRVQAGPDHLLRLVDRGARPGARRGPALFFYYAARAVRGVRARRHAQAADHDPGRSSRSSSSPRSAPRSPSASRATARRPKWQSSSPRDADRHGGCDGESARAAAVRSPAMTAVDPVDRHVPSRRDERNTELLAAELPNARLVDTRLPPVALRREPVRPGHPAQGRRRRACASRTTRMIPQRYRGPDGVVPAAFLAPRRRAHRHAAQGLVPPARPGGLRRRARGRVAVRHRRVQREVDRHGRSSTWAGRRPGRCRCGSARRCILGTGRRELTRSTTRSSPGRFDTLAAGLDDVPGARSGRTRTHPSTCAGGSRAPHASYAVHASDELVGVSTTDKRFGVPAAVILKLLPRDGRSGPLRADAIVAAACRFHRAPYAVYAGFNAHVKVRGIQPPRRLQPSPLHLILRSLSRTPSTRNRLVVDTFEFLDMDAY